MQKKNIWPIHGTNNRNCLLGSTDIELTQQRFKIKSPKERVKENHE